MRFNMRFPRLRLRTKIFLGFGLLIALLLGIGGFGSYALSVVGDEIDRLDGITGNSNRLQDLALQMELIRGDLADFGIDLAGDELHAANDAEARALDLLTQSAEYTLSSQRRAMFNGVADKLRAFRVTQARFTSLLQTGATDRQELLARGSTLQSALTDLTSAAVASPVASDAAAAMAARLAVLTAETTSLRFLATLDPALIASFDNAAAAALAGAVVPGRFMSPAVQSAVPPLSAALARYVAGFDKAAPALVEAASLNAEQIRPDLRDMRGITRKALERLASGYEIISQRAYDISSTSLRRQLGLSAIATFIGIVIAWLIARTISRPVVGMTEAMKRLATGDTATDIPGRNRADEIGEMAATMEVFRQQAIENTRLAAAQEEDRMAKERLRKAMETYTEDFGLSVSGVMDSFMAASATMRQAASEVTASARQTQASTTSTVEGAVASSRDLNAVAAAAEEMAASIIAISEQVAHVSRSVQAAVHRATQTDAKVGGLSAAADRIGDIVHLITGIAGRTNLLALNATIEAARAGEAGKGFAVVAGEVKTLAAQTAQATNEIRAQITAIRDATGDAVKAVQDVVTAISEVETVASAIAAAIDEQATATREITASVQVVSANTTTAADAMQQVLAIVDDTNASSRAALEASTEVSRTAETLQSEVTHFLSAMSSAQGDDRRLYERIPVNGLQVTLNLPDHSAVQAAIEDISRGGIGILHHCSDPVGTDMALVLPGGHMVRGRVARNHNGVVALAFRQDEASLAQIDQALAQIGEMNRQPRAGQPEPMRQRA
jgi:methyl-accepting chemotaxis protein